MHFLSSEETGDVRLVGDRVLVGRGADADIQLDSKMISRRHCALSRIGDGWQVEDLESANATFVNGKVLGRGKVRLAPGDTIQLNGSTKFVFHKKELIGSKLDPEDTLTPNDSDKLSRWIRSIDTSLQVLEESQKYTTRYAESLGRELDEILEQVRRCQEQTLENAKAIAQNSTCDSAVVQRIQYQDARNRKAFATLLGACALVFFSTIALNFLHEAERRALGPAFIKILTTNTDTVIGVLVTAGASCLVGRKENGDPGMDLRLASPKSTEGSDVGCDGSDGAGNNG